MVTHTKPLVVDRGRTRNIFDGELSGSGSKTIDFQLQSETLLLSVYVRSTSGDIDVKAETNHYPGESKEVITLPTLSAPTVELVFKKAAVALGNCRVIIDHTDDCDIQVVAKGLGVGELTVSVIGASNARASQVTVESTATLLIPASLDDRAGLVIKSHPDNTARCFLGYTAAEATTGNGYILTPGEPIAMDLAAGQAVYGISDGADLDIRILEAAT